MILKSLLVWLCIIPLAILNGGLRELVLEPLLGIKIALPLSSFSLCLLIFFVCLWFFPRMQGGQARDYILIGIIWVALTVCFEAAFGMFRQVSLQQMLQAYNPRTGNLWLLVVVFVGVAPWLAGKIK
ncbi:hypothetical protein WJT86_04805 [Microvirga sp. W0021]|uniref:Uncharacterized protein n=1 Tax=Hohaiivirga grylli TaxID=3133970 RepID=A0ABV0BKQ4_9HYPH